MANIGTAYVRIAPNMTGIQGKIASGFRGSGNQVAKQFSGELSSKSAAIAGAVAGVAAAAVNKAMNLVGNSIGDAISRVDTLKRFPTVMKNLGYSAEEATREVDRMAKSVIGLPTSLDQITSLTQRLAPVSGGLKEATDTALAFNNAVLAGGGPVYRQADAIEQFSQMLSKGEPDMMAWRTLQEAMPATLSQTAKALGIASGNTTELYDQLKSGKISMEDFTGAIVDLNDKGLPGFKSFSEQAKDSVSGIATGITNAQTAITRGIAKIIDAIGQKNISNAISGIGKAFEVVLTVVADLVTAVAGNKTALAAVAGVVGGLLAGAFYVLAGAVWAALAPVLPIIAAFALLGTGIGLLVEKMGGWQKAWETVQTAVKPVWDALKQVGAFIWGLFKPAIDEMVKSVREAWAAFQPLWQQIKGPVMNALKVLAVVLLGPIVVAIGVVVAAILGIIYVIVKLITFFTKIQTAIYKFSSNAIKSIKSFGVSVVNTVNNAIAWFSRLGSKVKSSLGNFGSLLVNAGRDLVNGLIRGIKAAPGKVVEAIKSIASGAKDAFKNFLGIKSPSKVFAGYGRDINRGLAQGVSNNAGLVQNAVSKMAGSAMAGMTSPTISPNVAFGTNPAILSAGSGNGANNSTVHIGVVNIASDYDASRLLNTLGIKQDLYNKGVVSG